MDVLLRENSRPLADEKTALFGLMDRFIGSVEKYRSDFRALTNQKNNDLNQKKTEAQNSLKALSARHKTALIDLEKKKNSDIAEYQDRINNKTNVTTKELNSIESEINRFENRLTAELNSFLNNGKADIQQRKEYKKQLKDLFANVDADMGTTLLGASKRDNSLADVTIKDSVSTLQDAKSILSRDNVDEMHRHRSEIQGINRAWYTKFFQASKRQELLAEMAEAAARADKALEMIDREFTREYNNRRNEKNKSCAEFRTKKNNEKSVLINERDKYISNQNAEINKRNNKYQSDLNTMKKKQASEMAAQQKHYQDQCQNAETKWNQDLYKQAVSFIRHMEEEYPVARMNAWMTQFWKHPRRVSQYKGLPETQMNVLLGGMEVNISRWKQGQSSGPVTEVLKKYRCLFGLDSNQALKNFNNGILFLPYCISLETGNSIVISHEDSCQKTAEMMLNAVAMRMLRSVPATMMRFQLFDSNGIGAFSSLMSLDPAQIKNPGESNLKSIIYGETAKVHSNDMDKVINSAKDHMDEISADMDNYNSLREFNNDNPLSKQPFSPMLMTNFPGGLKDSDLKTLNTMISTCGKWGYSLLAAQPDKEKTRVKDEAVTYLKELHSKVTVLRLTVKSPYLQIINPHFNVERWARIQILPPPEKQEIDQVKADIRQESLAASSVKIYFDQAKDVHPEKSELYKYTASEGLSIPLGYLDGGSLFRIPFDDKHVHAMIYGATGSGKTNLLHVMLLNTMLRYSPEEVSIYLIDFKRGSDFRIYTQYNLPSFKSINVSSEPEIAMSVIEEVLGEMNRRAILFGTTYNKLSDYNRDHPSKKLPRMIVIVDELYTLAQYAPEEVHKGITDKLDEIFHQGRSFGAHVIVCGQDLEKVNRFDTMLAQSENRITMHCTEEKAKLLLAESGVSKLGAIESTDQGACIFSIQQGNDPHVGHTAFIEHKRLSEYLKGIQNHYNSLQQYSDVKIYLTRVEDNPNHPVQRFAIEGKVPKADHNRMYIGEPITFNHALYFRPQENVLLGGGTASERGRKAANSLLLFMAISLIMQKADTGNMNILCTDFANNLLRSSIEEENDRLGQMASTFPAIINYSNGTGFNTTLDRMYDELQKRKMQSKPKDTAIWWFILKPEIGHGNIITGNSVIRLQDILQAGPENNIHIIMWKGDLRKAQQLTLSENLFTAKICMEMANDEVKLMGINELKPMPTNNTAVLITDKTERIRIYDLPDPKWMENLFNSIRKML